MTPRFPDREMDDVTEAHAWRMRPPHPATIPSRLLRLWFEFSAQDVPQGSPQGRSHGPRAGPGCHQSWDGGGRVPKGLPQGWDVPRARAGHVVASGQEWQVLQTPLCSLHLLFEIPEAMPQDPEQLESVCTERKAHVSISSKVRLLLPTGISANNFFKRTEAPGRHGSLSGRVSPAGMMWSDKHLR